MFHQTYSTYRVTFAESFFLAFCVILIDMVCGFIVIAEAFLADAAREELLFLIGTGGGKTIGWNEKLLRAVLSTAGQGCHLYFQKVKSANFSYF